MIYDITSSRVLSIYTQERLVLHFVDVDDQVKMWTDLEGSESSPLAVYRPDEDGAIYIDMTDYIRAYQNDLRHVYVKKDDLDAYDLTTSVVGLISPNSVIIPPSGVNLVYIMAPSVMYAPIGSGLLQYCIYGDGYYMATARAKYLPGNTTANILNENSVPAGTTRIEFWHLTDNIFAERAIRPLMCDHNYAMVEWVDYTGKTRRHTFEVVKSKTESADAYSLLPTDNEYVEIKGRRDGFTLRLTGLNAYDMWYYADVITSSNVNVSLDGTNYDRVQVTKKDITIPDGNAADGTLEITINWKRYDAVAL